MIGLGMSLSRAQFNTRAAAELGRQHLQPGFLADMVRKVNTGEPFVGKQQQAFINAVHANRRLIGDAQVRDYAAGNARGAD